MIEGNGNSLFDIWEADRKFANWIGGFSAGESSFQLCVSKLKKYPKWTGCKAYFSITLRADDIPILLKIREFLQCGTVRILPVRKGDKEMNRERQARYEVTSMPDLANKIVPFFERYKLRSKKTEDFEIWRECINICYSVYQRKPERREQENGQGSRKLKWTLVDIERFTHLRKKLKSHQEYKEIPWVPSDGIVSPDSNDADFAAWLSGFVAGEGSLQLHRGKGGNTGTRSAFLEIPQRKDDIQILQQIKHFLGCGAVYLVDNNTKPSKSRNQFKNTKPQAMFTVCDKPSLANIVVPLFTNNPIRAKKQNDFVIWKEGIILLDEVCQRPVISRGGLKGQRGGGGWFPKWKPEEIDRFNKLHKEIREVREYKEPIVV